MQTRKRYLVLIAMFLLAVLVLVGCGERTYDYDKTGILSDGVFNYKVVEGVKLSIGKMKMVSLIKKKLMIVM